MKFFWMTVVLGLLAARGEVISDSMKIGGDRVVGAGLDKQAVESGGGKWRALKGLVFSADGVMAESAAGGACGGA